MSYLVKAIQPYERLSLNFKGPLPSNNRNNYFLCVIDKFSLNFVETKFFFCFLVLMYVHKSVIASLTTLFSMFSMPAYIYSDRGATFLSRSLSVNCLNIYMHHSMLASIVL